MSVPLLDCSTMSEPVCRLQEWRRSSGAIQHINMERMGLIAHLRGDATAGDGAATAAADLRVSMEAEGRKANELQEWFAFVLLSPLQHARCHVATFPRLPDPLRIGAVVASEVEALEEEAASS